MRQKRLEKGRKGLLAKKAGESAFRRSGSANTQGFKGIKHGKLLRLTSIWGGKATTFSRDYLILKSHDNIQTPT